MDYVLSLITFLPVLGILFIVLVPKDNARLVKIIGAVFTGLQVILAVYIYMAFDRSSAAFQFTEQYKWIPAFNIEYFVGLPGFLRLYMLFFRY